MRTVDPKEQDLFLEAIEIESPFERDRFLTERCAGNDELRKRILHLIELHGVEGFVLDEPVDDPLDKIETEREGQVIGPYRLVRRLGEGGMGSVWRAEQTRPVRRDVAIKIIKLGMDTRNVIARFQAERQALAMMDHPSITKVYDAGATESGRPYFVMELVDGLNITDYCDRHRLNLTERLELFCQVCQAVQHAHQKGLIHRDLKPSNVLITRQDDKAIPKIIDFGIAKATRQRLVETTLMTHPSVAMIGTPQYMSPEQAEMNNPNTDPDLQGYVKKHFEYGRLDIDNTETRHEFEGYEMTSQELGYGLGAEGTPTTVFLQWDDEQVKYITRLPGYADLNTFTKVLRYIATDAYEDQTFEEFIQVSGSATN